MKEVAANLFVGNQRDAGLFREHYPNAPRVLAAKEPWHRAALGYKGRGAPKDSPEYLVAERGNDLVLNLVDAKDPKYISTEAIDTALGWMGEQSMDEPLGVFCNQGKSRSPTVAFLFLHEVCGWNDHMSLIQAQYEFRNHCYPLYQPGPGITRWLWARSER